MLKGWLKYAALFALCAWMFFAGLLVGRGTSPVEFDTEWFQHRLALLFNTGREDEVPFKKPELDFYAALKANESDLDLSSEFSDIQKPGEKEGSTIQDNEDGFLLAENSLPLKKSRKAMTMDSQKVAGNTARAAVVGTGIKHLSAKGKVDDPPYGALPEPEEKKRILPEMVDKVQETSSFSPDVSAYTYTIQIASYLDEEDALRHISKLEAKGYNAYKSVANVDDKVWFRVRTGSFGIISKAKEQLKMLEQEGVKGLIIRKE
ncbi:conserved exported hypothetical protein [Desulfamplus magnetovallimortis]|uniref:SPOR domain-containing protein n=1 Tax=Desulfamplus magnetovallimortis TaxID=1246637 RepID=A0A1W1HA55_9BACT|nr:SPOR domain-containing protein [Desulfamplus magnetovallimortis]SLM29323.1 conserved exported hypothetical protein [Desulfamplus magnetovallimortis]